MKKIGIVCSSGGHLTQALSVIEAFEGFEVFLIVHDFPSLRGLEVKGIHRIHRLPLYFGYSSSVSISITLLINTFQILTLLLKERPFLLFSTGAEIALPAFFLGKLLFKARLIFLESLARVKAFSLTGKCVYAITDLFLVQWPELLNEKKPKAIYRGRLI